jgi:formate hydrogenlyase subunit 3/multisubunit Na+/H+ antiporter MnhD subunit
MLKVIIFILLLAMIASLSTGFYFLVKDQGNSRKRLMYALGIRVSLAALLLACIAYGIGTGQLGSQAPWDAELHPERVINSPAE